MTDTLVWYASKAKHMKAIAAAMYLVLKRVTHSTYWGNHLRKSIKACAKMTWSFGLTNHGELTM